jgi:hypothetical protein
MSIEIRRTLTWVQTTYEEGGKSVPVPTKLVSAIAIIKNPWFGRGWVENLRPEIQEHGPVLGKLLTDLLLEICGDKIEGCGKASIVREAVNAKSYLAFTNTRGGAGTSLMIPLMHKDDGGMRSHYQTIHTTVPDAPGEDEILIALGASIGGHPLHRIGNRYDDLRDMGRDLDNPAGV